MRNTSACHNVKAVRKRWSTQEVGKNIRLHLESEVGQVGEQHCVMYDQDKELCRFHRFIIIIYLFFIS